MLKKIPHLIAATILAVVVLCNLKLASATSVTGITVANPTAQSASPTVTNLTVTGTITATAGGSVLVAGTTTQIALLSNPIGTLYRITENVAAVPVTNSYNLGMSTANAVDSCVYVAVSTSAAAVAGAACHN